MLQGSNRAKNADGHSLGIGRSARQGGAPVAFRSQREEQARRPPAPTAMPTELRLAASAVGCRRPHPESPIEGSRWGAERRSRTSAVAIVTRDAGTSGVLTVGKRTRIPGDVNRPGPRGDLGLIER